MEICTGKDCGTTIKVVGGRYLCEHNNFEVLYPYLIDEWDYEKNDKSPREYTRGSRNKVWWICKDQKHSWQATIYNRTNKKRGTGCSYCTGKKVDPSMSLAIIYPKLAEEWDYTKNNISPEEYLPYSRSKVWWICSKGHNFDATIGNRVDYYNKGIRGCPYCSGRRVDDNNCLEEACPELCKEWHPDNIITPYEVTKGSNRKVFWICSKGHIWKARICKRSIYNQGCSICSPKSHSKAQIKWLQSIEVKEKITIQHALSPRGEYYISGIGKVDGYCKETNTVYEFHGDFWHGNPTKYPSEDLHPVKKKKYGDLYSKTLQRDDKIRQLGYSLVVKWEGEDPTPPKRKVIIKRRAKCY